MSEVLRDFPEVNGLYIFRCEPVPLVNQVKGSVIDVFLGGGFAAHAFQRKNVFPE